MNCLVVMHIHVHAHAHTLPLARGSHSMVRHAVAACAGTTILVEVPAGNDADAVAAAVERVFAGGLAMGVFLSTRNDSVSETVTVDDISADLAACARVASARCPKVSANQSCQWSFAPCTARTSTLRGDSAAQSPAVSGTRTDSCLLDSDAQRTCMRWPQQPGVDWHSAAAPGARLAVWLDDQEVPARTGVVG